jgi:hypothetical protein
MTEDRGPMNDFGLRILNADDGGLETDDGRTMADLGLTISDFNAVNA